MAEKNRKIEQSIVGHKHWFIEAIIRLVQEKHLATFGAIIILLMGFVAIFGDLIAPYGMNETHFEAVLQPPGASWLLGTDSLGRDILSRCIIGTRITLFVGLGATALVAMIAVSIGIVSGYIGGRFDIFLQRFVDAWMCLPPLIILLIMSAILGPSMLNAIVAIGVLLGIPDSRIVRSQVLMVKEEQYVQAAVACGCNDLQVIIMHIVPNVVPTAIIVATMEFGYCILIEATISFLGFGVPPPYPTWGGMLGGTSLYHMTSAPWLSVWPGLLLAAAVFGANMFGDGIRDILDPQLRGSGSARSALKAARIKGIFWRLKTILKKKEN